MFGCDLEAGELTAAGWGIALVACQKVRKIVVFKRF